MTGKPVSEMSFEEAMKELEAVVGQLEHGDVALDASITLYERGAALKKRCEEELARAEEKVSAWGGDNQWLRPANARKRKRVVGQRRISPLLETPAAIPRPVHRSTHGVGGNPATTR